MKVVVAILAFFLAITLANAKVNDDNNNVDSAWWFNYPHPYPYYHLAADVHTPKTWPHRRVHHPIHAEKMCHKAVHDPELKACASDYFNFLRTQKVEVSSECCSALENVGAHCPVVKARHPFVANIVKKYCPSA